MRQISVLMFLMFFLNGAYALPVIQENDFGIEYVYFASRGLNSKPGDQRVDIWGTEQLMSKTWRFSEKLLVAGKFGVGGQTLTANFNFDPPFERRSLMMTLGGGLKYKVGDKFIDAQLLFIPQNPGLEYEYIVPHADYGLYGYHWLELQISLGLQKGPFYYGLRTSYLNILSPSVVKQTDDGYESLIYDLPSSFDPALTLGAFIGVHQALSEKCYLMTELEALDQLSLSLGMGIMF